MVAFDVSVLARNLIGKMEIHDFNQEVRENRAARFEAALELDQLNQLYNLSKMESFLKSEVVPTLPIDIFHDGHLMRLADVQKKSGKSCLDVVVDHFCDGSTIRIRDVEKSDDQVSQFVSEVQRYFAAQSQVNLYLTPPTKTGFPPHFDITDVFIVQCLGRKEWKIYQDYSNKIELPMMETNWDPDRFKPSASAETHTLCAGDVLYLPRGVMHEAFCGDRESMHLTVSIVPLTFADLIAKVLRAAAEADVEFRRRVPWSIETEDGRFDELTTQIRGLILKLANQNNLIEVMADERRSLQPGSRSNHSGALTSAIANLLEKSNSAC